METMKITYKSVMEFEEIVGGIPEDKEIIKGWLGSNGIQDNEELAERISAGTIPPEELEKVLSKITTTFMATEKGEPAIESRCVKAGIKQAAGVMGLYSAVPGLKELIKEGSEVGPRLIPLCRSSDSLQIGVKLVHTKSRTGEPLNSIGRYRFVKGVHMEFFVYVTDRGAISAYYGKKKSVEEDIIDDKNGKKSKKRGKQNDLSDEMLEDILKYMGEFTGLGANRSQGFGKGKLISLTRLDDEKQVAE